MKVFLNALVVHLILNVYVFLRGWKVMPNRKGYRYSYALLFLSELLVYLTGFFFWKELPQDILRTIGLIGTSWMILVGYTAALFLLYDACLLANRKIRKKRNSILEKKQVKRSYYIAALACVITAMCYGNYRYKNPVITELDLIAEKKNSKLDSVKIVMAADLHLGTLINKEMLRYYVDLIMSQKPDIILLVGDIIDHDLPPLIEQRMDEEFRLLKAPLGVYVSTGNHEYRFNYQDKIRWLSDDAKLTMLRDSAVNIADAFYLIGREDDKAPVRKELPQILKDIDRSLPTIVMNHEPHRLYEESDEKIDLALYGHTHDGQLFPYNILINWFYEVGYGYKKKNNTHIYVTSGLGLSGPEYRIGTLSELVVINLKFE